MYRMTRWLALAVAVTALAACSHHPKNPALAHVPANTPYVMASLQPLTNDALAGIVPASASTTLWKPHVQQALRMADHLAAEGNTNAANLVRALENSIKGKTYAQFVASTGMNPHGPFALYGLGLSPVMRGQLNDPAKFHAYIGKLAKAYGKPFPEVTLGKRTYHHVVLGDSNLQMVVSTHDKHFVWALLPANAGTQQLRLALGIDTPKHSLADSGRLAKLANQEGYGPYWIAYLDTTKLPALLAGGHDPMFRALLKAQFAAADKPAPKDLAKGLPASCQPGLARIAARVPMISMGFTKLDRKDKVEQVDVHLAPDIVKAFKGIGTHVPGLGTNSAAPLSIALALPMQAIRSFWLSQAEAVQAKPFTCPALKGFNKTFAKMQKWLPRTAMPPLGELRGFRLVLDQLDLASFKHASKNNPPKASGRILLASRNPSGLLNTVQAFMPALAKLHITANGKPVALPPKLTAKLKVPVWIAMNKDAVAIGFGKGEKAKLANMLRASVGAPGTLSSGHISGKLYADWMDAIGKDMAKAQVKTASGKGENPKAAKEQADVKAQFAAMARRFKQIKDITSHAQMTSNGLRLRIDMQRK